MSPGSGAAAATAGVDLLWLPLGAGGGGCVRANGRAFEAVAAQREHRSRQQLFHSALEVRVDGSSWALEMGPAWGPGSGCGVVAVGPVGLRALGRSRLFRYEVRCSRGGAVPDAAEAVGGPVRVSADPTRARRVLSLVRDVPRATWGRDELAAGEMWNSNSLVAWLLALSDHDLDRLHPPRGGRAPGWAAGLVVARAGR